MVLRHVAQVMADQDLFKQLGYVPWCKMSHPQYHGSLRSWVQGCVSVCVCVCAHIHIPISVYRYIHMCVHMSCLLFICDAICVPVVMIFALLSPFLLAL